METEQVYEVETDQVDIQRPAPTSEEGAFELFAALTDQKRRLKDELSAIERQLEPLEEVLLAIFECHPGKGAHKTGGFTIYQAHEIWARSDTNRRATIDVLVSMGYDYDSVASVNASRLSGIVREFMKKGEEVPTALAAVIKISEKIVVRACKS